MSNDAAVPDLGFRPDTYFWPADFSGRLLSRIKGAQRRAIARRLIQEGRIDELPSFLAQAKLSAEDLRMWGSMQPSHMGGEYLPDLSSGQVEVARIVIASTTRDVVAVHAWQTKNCIRYKVVDEYEGDTLSGPVTRRSRRPLTLGDLTAFLDSAWSIYEVLGWNFLGDSHGDLQQMLDFLVAVESEFYPRIDDLYRQRIRNWARERFLATGYDEAGRGKVQAD